MDPSLQIDGQPATAADLVYLATSDYGAYTSFRVEDGRVRGLDLHLARLDASALELFGEAVGEPLLRQRMREAVGGRGNCWLRVSLFSPEIRPRHPDWRGQPRVMTRVSAPPSPLAASLRLAVRTYGREAAHLKHAATFGLIRARRLARADGFDDALFADAAGHVSEGSLWNIGFVKGDRIIWPRAPMLAGVGQALIKRGLASVGLASSTRPVRAADLSGFDAAFICNSATPVCPVSAIGETAYAPAPAMMTRLAEAAAFVAPEPL